MIGMPIGPPSQRPDPKSAWTLSPAPIDPTIAEEFLATGSASTRLFQTLEAGKTGHCRAPGSGKAAGGPRRDGECKCGHEELRVACRGSRRRRALPSSLSRWWRQLVRVAGQLDVPLGDRPLRMG